MFEVEVEVFINRSVEEVFNFIADNENDPQWCVPVVETDRIVGDAPGPNTKYTFASKAGLGKINGEFQINEFVPYERITWDGASLINKFAGEYLLRAEGDGTHLVEKSSFSARGVFKLVEASMSKEVRDSLTRQLENLKQLLEE